MLAIAQGIVAVTTVMFALASVCYFLGRDWKHGLYWALLCAINLVVTSMGRK